MKLLIFQRVSILCGVYGSVFYVCLSDIGAVSLEGLVFLFGFCFEV